MVNRKFNTRRTGYTFILIFALMSAGIIFTGYLYYRNYEQKYRANVESQLSSIADLKMSELALWRRERLGDGSLLFKNKTFSALVRRFMENPEDADAKRRLHDWMGKYTTAYQYARVVLFDAQAGTRLSAPEKANTDDLEIERNVAAILREGQVAFQDFHKEATDGLIHLAVVVPIFDEADETQALGVLAIDIDPAAYLYPFISRWPTPSKTGETLLIRRDGDDVLYLNELKFNKDAALNLRIPLTKTDVPSVKAALGQKGVVEGLDYRGKSVIAAVGAVPDSPWYLVARIDTEEVYGPLIERMWLMVTVVGLLLTGAGMGMGLIWRQRSARFYKERYQVAEALRESEERYRSLFENNHAVMLVINPDDGNIVEANPAAVAYYGWSKEELKLKKISDINTLTPDQIHAEMELAHAEKRSHFFFKHLRADGTPRDVEVYSGPVNVKGRALLYSIVFDITERRQAEKSLQRANALLNDTQRLAKIGGWEFDVEKRSMFWTDEVYRIHDLDPGEIIPDSTEHIARSLECYRPEDRPVILSTFQRCAQEGEPYDLEFAFTTTKGRKLWIRTTANPSFDSGKVARVVGDIMDITERKLAEEELQRFFDLVPDMVCIASTDGYFLKINPMWEATLGYAEREILSTPFMDFIHPDDRDATMKEVERQIGGEATIRFVNRYRCKDGDYKWLEWMATPSVDKRLLFAAARDVTERRQAEINLLAAKEQAEAATKLKDKFVSLVAHDLRSPFASIMGLLKLFAERKSHPEDEMGQKIFERIFASGERMMMMIEDLLKINRLHTGQITPQPKFFKGHIAVAVTIGSLSHSAAQKGILIINEVPVDMRIYADPPLFDEILLNLLSNAIKFCSKGDKITVFVPPGLKSAIAVRDTGKGMDEKTMSNLFKEDMRTTTPGTAGELGTGLGLAFCHDIIKAHGGELAVTSELGKGTEIFVTFPYVRPLALVVDDDPMALLIVRRHLEKIGIDVVEALDGERALAAVKHKPPHIVITDITMPGMDGFALLDHLKHDNVTRAIPVIVMTSADGDARERALRRGANDFVSKPIDVEDFIPRVRRFVG